MVFIYLFMVRASQQEFAIPILCTTCVLGSVSLSPVGCDYIVMVTRPLWIRLRDYLRPVVTSCSHPTL